MNILFIFCAAAGIVLASLSGLVFASTALAGWLNKRLSLLTSLAAGVFLITSVFLIREVFELTSGLVAAISILGGLVLFTLLQYLIPESHHHHDDAHCDKHDRRSAIKIMLGDAFHNVGDGLIIVPAFMIDVSLGIVTAVSIFIHEFVQELSEYVVLRQAGYSHRQALGRNALVALTIFVGVGLGFLLSRTATLQGIVLGVSAGAFLQIVFSDLLSHGNNHTPKKIVEHVLLFVIGALLIIFVQQMVPHAHVHGEQDHGELHAHDTHNDHDEEYGHTHEEVHNVQHDQEDHQHDQ
jgi:zinc and cadmium transporter